MPTCGLFGRDPDWGHCDKYYEDQLNWIDKVTFDNLKKIFQHLNIRKEQYHEGIKWELRIHESGENNTKDEILMMSLGPIN